MNHVYILSRNFRSYVKYSIRTLSGAIHDRAAVSLMHTGRAFRQESHHNIDLSFQQVRTPVPEYWLSNKWHLTQLESERVAFLDTDTLILRPPIETVRSGSDITAREVPGFFAAPNAVSRRRESWANHLRALGLDDTYPYLSCGFMIFQNGSHRRIRDAWIYYINEIISGKCSIKPSRFAEQQAMSLACAAERLSFDLMTPNDHVYLMNGEPPENGVVLHCGTPKFYRHMTTLVRNNVLNYQSVGGGAGIIEAQFRLASEVFKQSVSRIRRSHRDNQIH